jgi:hypothetical protein
MGLLIGASVMLVAVHWRRPEPMVAEPMGPSDYTTAFSCVHNVHGVEVRETSLIYGRPDQARRQEMVEGSARLGYYDCTFEERRAEEP